MSTDPKWCNDSELYFRKEDASRIPILHKEIGSDIELCNVERILDFGSGDGKIFDSISSIDSYEITMHDTDIFALTIARKKFEHYTNIHYEGDSKKLKSNYYDAIIINNVVMCLSDQKDWEELLNTVLRIKSKDANIYVGLTHPCFLEKKFYSYTNDYVQLRQPFNYFNNGSKYIVFMDYKNNNEIEIRDTFWNMSFIINSFLSSGFKLSCMKELKDVELNSYSPYLLLKFN